MTSPPRRSFFCRILDSVERFIRCASMGCRAASDPASFWRHSAPPATFGAAAFITAFVLLRGAIGAGYEALPYLAGVSSFAASRWIWRRSGPAPSIGAGIGRGVCVAALSHFATLYLALVKAFVLASLGDEASLASDGSMPPNPVVALAGAGVLGFASLVFFGRVTIPIGALTGAIVAWWDSRDPSR